MKETFKKLFAAVMALACICCQLPRVFAAEAVDADKITASSVLLYDQDTGKILFSKNTEAQIAPASTTKILTAVVALENADVDDVVSIGAEVDNSRGSLMGLVSGEKLPLKDLLYGMFLNSGNDAAAAIAVHIAGSTDAFAEKMNETAQKIGMTNSHFKNPSGLDAENHLVTVEDMAKLTSYALSNYPILQEIAQTKTYTISATDSNQEHELKNTNKLVYADSGEGEIVSYEYDYATGLKTGATPNAGNCLVATASKDGQNLILLLYGDPSEDGVDRWSMAKYLFEYGFNQYENVYLTTLAESVPIVVTVSGAAENDENGGKMTCSFDAEETTAVTLPSNWKETGEITCKVSPNEMLQAPVKKGDAVGTAEYYYNEELIYRGSILADRDMISQVEYQQSAEGPVSSIAPVDIDGDNPSTFQILWIWLIIPVILIAFLIIRLVAAKRRRKRRYYPKRRGKGTVYRNHSRRGGMRY